MSTTVTTATAVKFDGSRRMSNDIRSRIRHRILSTAPRLAEAKAACADYEKSMEQLYLDVRKTVADYYGISQEVLHRADADATNERTIGTLHGLFPYVSAFDVSPSAFGQPEVDFGPVGAGWHELKSLRNGVEMSRHYATFPVLERFWGEGATLGHRDTKLFRPDPTAILGFRELEGRILKNHYNFYVNVVYPAMVKYLDLRNQYFDGASKLDAELSRYSTLNALAKGFPDVVPVLEELFPKAPVNNAIIATKDIAAIQAALGIPPIVLTGTAE